MPSPDRHPAKARLRILKQAEAAIQVVPASAGPYLVELLERNPNDAEALFLRAFVCLTEGNFDQAVSVLKRAVRAAPASPEYWQALGLAAKLAKRLLDSERAYREAACLKPDDPAVLADLANVEEGLYCFGSEAVLRARLAKLDPTPARYHQLGLALCYAGRVEAGAAALRRAVAADPDSHSARSALIMAVQMIPGYGPDRIFEDHRAWGSRHASKNTDSAPYIRRTGRPLRIGYLSGQFFDCSHSFFIEPLLAAQEGKRVQTFCYSNTERPDTVTRRLKQHAYQWRDIARMPDEEADALVRRDKIDVLVDLDGHAKGHRLLLVGRKPAPVQATYIGYPNTTGLDAVDYRITDSNCDPPGQTERLHTESLLRLDPCFLTYQPPHDAPPPGRPPLLVTGRVTFACFSALPKLNSACLDLFARVLLAVPGSRLMLKSLAFCDPVVRRRIRGLFARRAIESSRLTLLSYFVERRDHLEQYGQADIALDAFPYVGTTTTCEALWMGVPVVSLVGQTHVQRVGLTLLKQAGLPELATDCEESYVAAAIKLANDAAQLADIRRRLRGVLRRSALMQHRTFARRFETLLATHHSHGLR